MNRQDFMLEVMRAINNNFIKTYGVYPGLQSSQPNDHGKCSIKITYDGFERDLIVHADDGYYANEMLRKRLAEAMGEDVFIRYNAVYCSYRETKEQSKPRPLTFGAAIEVLKSGRRVARKNWNGKGMWLMLCANVQGKFTLETGETCKVRDYIYMKTANDELVPWTASQSDVLAEDWEVVS